MVIRPIVPQDGIVRQRVAAMQRTALNAATYGHRLRVTKNIKKHYKEETLWLA
jgi:hypothetical protein